VYLNAGHANDAEEILASIAARLDISRTLLPNLQVPTGRMDPLAPPRILKQLGNALHQEVRQPAILIDGPLRPEVAFQLFGRWRDELFGIPATWVVAAHQHRLAEYLTPPADVFFDVVLSLGPLTRTEALEVLSRRDALGSLEPRVRHQLVEGFDGTPRHLLRLARQYLDRNHDHADAHAQARANAISTLSPSSHMVLAEMQGRGPVAATDGELRSRLGISDRQLRRSFLELENAGLVGVVPGARGTPGRPPKTFQLTDLGQIDLAAA
jgi:AraC-like DNA-binding protein